MSETNHFFFINQTIKLAKSAVGQTSPNPLVGALVVKNKKILAKGYHKRAGADHAEVNALKKLSKESAKGATLYVNLEPCSHHGRTPPCVETIIQYGIKKVVIGMSDPNPKVSGRGIRALKKAGIEVVENICKKESRRLNRAYVKWITTRRPYVILKAAISLDGKIATASGNSKWITGVNTRKYVHQIRNQVDAILVGAETFRKDNPRLTVRLSKKNQKQPNVVVVSRSLKWPKGRKSLGPKGRKIFVATTTQSSQKRREQLTKEGYHVLVFAPDKSGNVPIRGLLKKLGQLENISLIVEGGGGLYSSFVKAKLVDQFIICIAPKIIGGDGRNLFPSLSSQKIDTTLFLGELSIKKIDDDIVVEKNVDEKNCLS